MIKTYLLMILLFSTVLFADAPKRKVIVYVNAMIEQANKDRYIKVNYEEVLKRVINFETNLPQQSKATYLTEAGNNNQAIVAIESYFIIFKPRFNRSKIEFEKCTKLLVANDPNDKAKLDQCKDRTNADGFYVQLINLKSVLSLFESNKTYYRNMIAKLPDNTNLKRDAQKLFDAINNL